MSILDVIITILLLVLIVLLCMAIYHGGYKKGQLDALNGKQQYKLIEFNDGTREYCKNPKPDDFMEEFKIIK